MIKKSEEYLQELLALEQSYSEKGREHVQQYKAQWEMVKWYVAVAKKEVADGRVL